MERATCLQLYILLNHPFSPTQLLPSIQVSKIIPHHHILSPLLISLFCNLLSHSIPLCHPDEFKSFLKRLPSTHFLPISSVHLLWGSDWDLQARYRLLQSSLEIQRLKIQRTARKLFGLSIRCHHNPNHQMPRERWVEIWPPHHDGN